MVVHALHRETTQGEFSVNEDVFDIIEALTVVDDIWDALDTYIQDLKFDNFTYYHLSPAGAEDIGTHFFASRGNDNVNLTTHKAALFDVGQSFIHCIRQMDRPIAFSNLSALGILESEQIDFLKTMHFAKRETGFIIPTHGARGRAGCFIFVSSVPTQAFTKREIRELQWASLACHNAYTRLRKGTQREIKPLTVREREILTWVAHGKSNSVIADIIGISQHTVNGYLRSIYLKTGTSDRTTAALRGVGEALINL
jgi:DNA-binding CsgD family transcriptional regulator